MADNSSPCLSFMDKLWFQHNILFTYPTPGRDTRINKAGMALEAPQNQPTKFCLKPPSEESISSKQPAADNNSNKPAYTVKKQATLNLVIGQPLIQLQIAPWSQSCSHSASLSTNTGMQLKRRRRTEAMMMRRYKTLSDLENYELKGFMDLGFMFHKEKLSPKMMSMIPGLQRLGKKGKAIEGMLDMGHEGVQRPYLSEAWFINRPDFSMTNLRMLPRPPKAADMKKHLLSWAREVASTVHHKS